MTEPVDENSNGETWFSDITGDGSSIAEQLQSVKDFAYRSFDRLDSDKNGFISHEELEAALGSDQLSPRERKFLAFLLENHDQIAEAYDEFVGNDGISRKDLESYFELIATLL